MITDTFLLEEIGYRQEITSSMVERAEVKRTRARSHIADAWFYGVGNRRLQDAALARQQQWGSPSCLGSLGLLGGLGELAALFQSSKCPYCGK